MLKVVVVGKDKRNIEKILKKYNLKLVKKNPDIVISYGGDGTILLSERLFPNIPKLFLRHSSICNKCYSVQITENEFHLSCNNARKSFW